jgi:hypothetical protein
MRDLVPTCSARGINMQIQCGCASLPLMIVALETRMSLARACPNHPAGRYAWAVSSRHFPENHGSARESSMAGVQHVPPSSPHGGMQAWRPQASVPWLIARIRCRAVAWRIARVAEAPTVTPPRCARELSRLARRSPRPPRLLPGHASGEAHRHREAPAC